MKRFVALTLFIAAALLACSPSGMDESEQTGHYRSMVGYYQRVEGQLGEGHALFFGDSHVQGLDVSSLAPKAVNFGIGTDTTDGLIKRLRLHGSAARAAVVVIHTGVNDLGWRGDDEIADNYLKILKMLPADVPVVMSAIFPVDGKRRGFRSYNKRIVAINKRLKQICATHNCTFINTGLKFADADGNLARSFHEGDGIHLSSEAYALWSADLHEALASLGVQGPCDFRRF